MTMREIFSDVGVVACIAILFFGFLAVVMWADGIGNKREQQRIVEICKAIQSGEDR